MSESSADTIRRALEQFQQIADRFGDLTYPADEALAALAALEARLETSEAQLKQLSEWHHRAEQGWADDSMRADAAEGRLAEAERALNDVRADLGNIHANIFLPPNGAQAAANGLSAVIRRVDATLHQMRLGRADAALAGLRAAPPETTT